MASTGGMSPGNLKVGFIYDGSYAGDFYHQRFAQIHEINVSLFSLIGGVLLACACRHWKQSWLLLFVWSANIPAHKLHNLAHKKKVQYFSS